MRLLVNDDELHAYLDAVPSGPRPGRLEVDWLAHARLYLLAPQAEAVPAPLAAVWGVLIVESTELEMDEWRLVDTDGTTMREGRLR